MTLSEKESKAIELIRSFAPVQTGVSDKPYFVGYSGGKDSDVLYILMKLANVSAEFVHNLTTVDAPDTIRYIQQKQDVDISLPDTSMWKLIVEKKTPPYRKSRYCCAELKERNGEGRFCVMGVRWAESNSRKNRGVYEVTPTADNRRANDYSKSVMFFEDNSDNRRQFETCAIKGQHNLNPIISWTDEDVWCFLKHYGVQSNPLYGYGFRRIGCIGCPNAAGARKLQFQMFPKYRDNYIRTFDKMLVARKEARLRTTWKSGEEVFKHWISG